VNPDAGQHGLIAKRRLLAGLHTRPTYAPARHVGWRPFTEATHACRFATVSWDADLLRSILLQQVACRIVPRRNPLTSRQLSPADWQLKLTLFYQLLPRSSRIRAAGRSQTSVPDRHSGHGGCPAACLLGAMRQAACRQISMSWQ